MREVKVSKTQQALGIKPSQVVQPKQSKGKKTHDCKETAHCRNSMLTARASTSKLIKVIHWVPLPKKDRNDKNEVVLYRETTSTVEGNIAEHPTDKDLKVVEVIQTYKESFISSDDDITILK